VLPSLGAVEIQRSSCSFSPVVIPAKAGIHHLPVNFIRSFRFKPDAQVMDSRLRGNDEALFINDLVFNLNSP
jgi:hypothetical protein